MSDVVVEPQPAATILPIRGVAGGVEVLMIRRADRGFFGGLMAFPGGAVEEVDRSELARSVSECSCDDGVHRVAALRETAEEIGIALTTSGPRVAPEGRGRALLEGLADQGMRLDCDCLTFVSRWVTPEDAPRRFDARFYLTALEEDLPIRLDESELVGWQWVTPAGALEKERSGAWRMFTPTTAHLRWLATRESVADALRSAEGADGRTLVRPIRTEDGSIVPVLVPAEQ